MNTENDPTVRVIPSGSAPDYTAAPRRARGRRRTGLILALGIGFSALGLGAATAGKDVHVPWGEPRAGVFSAVPETERFVVRTTNPDGDTVELWLTDAGAEGERGYCAAILRLDEPVEDRGETGCGPGYDTTWNTFGSSGVATWSDEEMRFAYRVGDAVRVVYDRDGTHQNLGVAEGWTVGLVEGPDQDGTLIGYDAQGREIGRLVMPPADDRPEA